MKDLLSTTRLLTLTGAGGTGKTRLALEVARDVLEEDKFADGVWLVQLAATIDPDVVPQKAAAALGLREEVGKPITSMLTEFLGARSVLLLLDNCEYLVGACAQLADHLLRNTDNLRILVTSLQGLGIAGETMYEVPTLSLPNLERLPPAESLASFEAVRLFLDRARAAKPAFELNEQNARAVAEVCYRLDGIPLAIELAAALVKVLRVQTIAARLDSDPFRLLDGGNPMEMPHHRTLRALIDWSYGLLSDLERALLRRLSVFAGGWTIEAAEAVCARKGIENTTVIYLLMALVTKSLVIHEERQGESRYRLLEPVRLYARDRLQTEGEANWVRRRHVAWCLALVEQAQGQMEGAEQSEWLDRLEREHDNVRAALAWSSQPKATLEGMRLAAAMGRFWQIRGYLQEGRQRLEKLLGEGSPTDLSARYSALNALGNLLAGQGEYSASEQVFKECLTMARQLKEPKREAMALACLGVLASYQCDYGRARPLLEQSLTIYLEMDRLDYASHPREKMGQIALWSGDYATARTLVEQSLGSRRERRFMWGIASALNTLGAIAKCEGHHEEAHRHYRESLEIEKRLRSKGTTAESLEGLAGLVAAQGQANRAARLFGAAEALRETIGAPLPPGERTLYNRDVADARDALADEAFLLAWKEGRALSLDEAVSYALGDDLSPGKASGAGGGKRLSRRQRSLGRRSRHVGALSGALLATVGAVVGGGIWIVVGAAVGVTIGGIAGHLLAAEEP